MSEEERILEARKKKNMSKYIDKRDGRKGEINNANANVSLTP